MEELWRYEDPLRAEGKVLCGVDEAGAGPLMGPVYAAAVILPREAELPGLNDSKKLTEKRREALYDLILDQAIAWSVARAEAAEIDALDILNARMLAMNRAIEGLARKADLYLIDGNRDHGTKVAIQVPHTLLVGGDGRSASIAAASIIAKVDRDALMCRYAEQFPHYGFESNKGYASAEHIEAIKQYGLSPVHRASFCRAWTQEALF